MSYPKNFGQLSYNEDNKQKFLAASKKLLAVVGKQLKEGGLIDYADVSVNPAGIAVGGDVYGHFNCEKRGYGVLVTITHSCFGNRQDGVVCYIQQRTPDAVPRKIRGHVYMGRIVGGNIYVNDIDVETVAVAALRALQRHPSASKIAA